VTGMSESTKAPISVTAVTAVALAIGAALLVPVAPGLHPAALILAIAAALVGTVAAVNARRTGAAGEWLAWVGVAIAAAAAIWIGIAQLA
jgi:hypothetical protein